MALIKEIEKNNTGVKPKYWRVLQTVRHYDRGEITIDLAGYLTKEDRIAGKNAVDSKSLTFPLQSLSETRDEVYPLSKTSIPETLPNGDIIETNPFIDSEDDL